MTLVSCRASKVASNDTHRQRGVWCLSTHPFPCRPLSPSPPPLPLRADFQNALEAALGSDTLPLAFMAVRRAEWEHFRGMSLEEEAAALYERY